MQDTATCPTTRTSRCRSPVCRRDVPEENPTGIYERTSTSRPAGPDAGWSSTSAPPRASCSSSSTGATSGISKDSHLAAEFDVDRSRPAGANALRLRVVKWSDATFVEDQDQWWHGGITRSVFLYATGPVYLADIRATPAWPTTWRPGRSTCGRRRLRGRRARARLDRRGRASTALPNRCAPTAGAPTGLAYEGWSRADAADHLRRQASRRPLTDDRGGAWAAVRRRMSRPVPGRVAGGSSCRTCGPGRPRIPTSTGSRSRLRAPDGSVAEGRAAGSASGGSRSAGVDLLVNGRAGPDPRRQPPRLRPAHRPGRRAPSRCAPTSC